MEKRASDGTVEVSFPDGAIRVAQADGTEKWSLPDGTVAQTFINGDKILTLPNGQREIHTKEHKVRMSLIPLYYFKMYHLITSYKSYITFFIKAYKYISTNIAYNIQMFQRREYPDGTVKIVYADGTQETRYSSGRKRLKDKDGNLLMDSYDN